MQIQTLDLHFQGVPGTIAAYLLPHHAGCILIETGPGSTLEALTAGLARHGYQPEDVTDVFVTHIHLDHAGACGSLARRGARVHVHKRGLPHLQDPARLLASAERIYGDQMKPLWGEMLPVPEENLHALHDGQVDFVQGWEIRSYDTPGHATHHMAFLVGDTLFSGDIGGVRLEGPPLIMLPMPPPEFHLEQWRQSFEKIRSLPVRQVAATHFGIYPDVEEHWQLLGATLDAVEAWIESTLPSGPTLEELRALLPHWFQERAKAHGLAKHTGEAHEIANPAWMSAAGIQRYWQKHRNNPGR